MLDTYDYARCHNFKHFFSNVSDYHHIWVLSSEKTGLFMFVKNEMYSYVFLRILVLCQQKNYTAAWDKIKAKSYQIPHDSHALQHAKTQKIILSGVSSPSSFLLFLFHDLIQSIETKINSKNGSCPSG